MAIQQFFSQFWAKKDSRTLPSFVCKAEHFDSSWYRRWALRIANGDPDLYRFGDDFAKTFAKVWEAMQFEGKSPRYRHRKMWEWCAIAQVLDERGQLQPGKRGCGFAVGYEPLASLFATTGAEILATDLQPAHTDMWAATGQQVASVDQIFWPNLIDLDSFRSKVRFQSVDMRDLSVLPERSFDFVWSSCSLEHLGSLEAGLTFVERATDLLKPGGVAVHTTEFNVSSRENTIEAGDNVLYRETDLRQLERRLRNRCATLHELKFDVGHAEFDRDYDRPPYYSSGRHHVKLDIGGFVSTSILLVISRQS
ncbi:class I SAM-dependent methyltransferase [Rhizobium sp. BK060]|uniref:class I SAM-dependent methyltransferase n=1 Tax=Rhizobium sp. BK060 TaxID=2587096 RepID=UPI0016142CEF|nr:class I SAM-dependent methyltransferase [Rhizobium sp. BK060]MBB3395041.1 SAM-dependent methyltransferase [Rhizobium sp. BK060]